MPRSARKKSSTGIYHVMLRGVNRQPIFVDDEDNEKFLRILTECKEASGFELFAYCLMGNHVHLLLKEASEGLELIFRRIGSRYVRWFNWKYNRSGHLFQDRFRSEAVENDGYFVVALRYIHQNPVKAGISASIGAYKWSSYNDYVHKNGIVDHKFALSIIGEAHFVAVMSEERNDSCMELSGKRLNDDELVNEISTRFRIEAIQIQDMPRDSMEDILRDILKFEGVSTRQLSRVTGVPVNTIWRL